MVADALVRHGHPSVTFVPDLRQVPAVVRERMRPGDLVLTLGAGDVRKVADALVRGARRGRGTTGRKG